MKKLLTILAVSSFALFLAPQSQANSGTGWDHGYYWGFWCDKGWMSMSFPYAGSYAGNWQINWSGIGDGGGGKGWNPGADWRSVGYNGTLRGPYNTMGAYGWAPYPNYEMYINDRESNRGGTTYMGQVNSDGGTYNVYRGNQAGYSGGGPQYSDNRTSDTGDGNHTITSQNHFNFWNSHGMTHGNWQSWCHNVESWSFSSGQAGGTVW
jgi:endo-1,4-beta-xylanase